MPGWFGAGPHALLMSLVPSASSLPVLLVIPAGVTADFFDRRRLLVIVQGVQAAIAGVLALLTAAGRTTPEVLLLFTFLLGCGTATQLPAYQSFISDCRHGRSSFRPEGRVVCQASISPSRSVRCSARSTVLLSRAATRRGWFSASCPGAGCGLR